MPASHPLWLIESEEHIGLREIPSKRHNPKIVNWGISLGAWWKDDETPWCGTFVAHCHRASIKNGRNRQF